MTIIINFSHTLTQSQLEQIERKYKLKIKRLMEIRTQFDHEQDFDEQVRELVDGIELTSEEWQDTLVNPPSLNVIAVALVAELHGRLGHFPDLIRLKPVPDSTPMRFEFAEVLHLQKIRDDARKER
jgi:hypothetical protein